GLDSLHEETLHTSQLCPPSACPSLPALCARFQGQDYGDGESFASPHQPCEECQCLAGTVTCQPKPCPQQCAHPVPPTRDACCPSCDGCLYEGQEYAHRAVFTPTSDPCRRCSCLGGNVLCAPVVCPPASCAKPSQKPGECCPQCQNPTNVAHVCQHTGQEYPEGTQWLSALDPCQECSCGPGGKASCQPVPCKATLCSHPAPGPCCPVCHDCIFEGERYAHGQGFQPESCLQCVCQDGNVRCEVIACPPASCTHPVTEPGVCCPRCQGCMHEGQDRADGSSWFPPSKPCQACLCADGIVTCTQILCVSSCPAQVEVPGECCPLMSDGHLHLQCHRRQCPSLLDCTQDQIQAPAPGTCCPTCAQALSNCTSDLLGNEIQDAQEPCYTCMCQDLTWVCVHRGCPSLSCPSTQRFTPPGSCCPLGHVECHIQECSSPTSAGRWMNAPPAPVCLARCTAAVSAARLPPALCIHVTNEDRGRPGVSWTKEVTVLIGDTMVQLLQDGVVMVDSRTVSLPFLKEPQLSVDPKGSTLLLNTNIGALERPLAPGGQRAGTYKGRLCGLCGNFNSFPQDDLRMRSGHLSLSEAAFGNSWKVADANATGYSRCAAALDANPCKESGYRSRKEANARCQVLKSPAFARCHVAVAPEPFFAACVYDLCACGAAGLEDCLCEVLEAYAGQCRQAGVMLQWRSPTLCAVGCPQERGYIFDECGPPCPKTCFNHAVPLGVLESHCLKPCVPGCQCPAGLVEHQAHCILPEACPPIIHGTL
ncbi:hypothetical protein E2320_004421, partial [Naja naja]